ncbi:MAG: SMC family ATPase [Bacteroidales bacterium]|nr:SMC family ATPase [Bacteroidales bacterium]
MRITHIELKDWGPHKSIDVDTDTGILGIVGSNGSGKSNLLQAIDYAFTGNLNGRTGTSYIRNYGAEGGALKAVVKIKFKKDGKEGEITREILQKSSKRLLKWDGAEYTKADDVEKMIKEILGVDKAALANAAFIKQGDIASLVQGTPAERNDIFRKLVQLSFIDKRSEDLLAKQVAVESSVKDYSELKVMLEDKAVSLDSELTAAMIKASNQEWASVCIGALREYADGEREMEKASAELAAANESLLKARDSFARTTALVYSNLGVKHDKLAEFSDTCAREIDEISGKLTAHAKVSGALGRIRAGEGTIVDCAEKLSVMELMLPDDLGSMKAREKELSDGIEAYTAYKEALEWYYEADKDWRDAESSAAGAVKHQRERKMAAYTELIECQNSIDALKWQNKLVSAKLEAVKAGKGKAAKCPCCGGELHIGSDDTVDALTAALASIKEMDDDLQMKAANLRVELETMASNYAVAASKVEETERKRAVMYKNVLDLAENLDGISEDEELCEPEEIDEILAPMLEELDVIVSRLKDASAVSAEIKTLEHMKARAEEDVAAARAEIVKFNGYDIDDGDVDRYNEKLTELREKRDSAAKYSSELDVLREHISLYGDLVEMGEETLKKINTGQEYLLKDPNLERCLKERYPDVLTAQEVLGFVETEKDIYNKATAEYDRIKKEVDANEKELKGVLEKIEQNKQRLSLIADLKKVREVIGKNGVPMAYMNTVFKGISAVVKDLLEKMNANFTVEPDPYYPMTFRFVRVDDDSEYDMPQEQLSGGQAIRLALALLIACQQIVLPEMGLLVLDEPSSHIDDDGIVSMRDMFQELVTVMDSADMQLVIVDHNANLMSAFSRTIKLGASENP